MTHISDYSFAELQRRYPALDVKDYERTNYDCGVTRIKYRQAVKPSMYFKLGVLTLGVALPGIIATDAVSRRTWDTYYFDTDSGRLFGATDNEAAEAINKKGLEILKQGKFVDAKSLFDKAYNICEKNYSNEEKFRNNRDATGKLTDVQEFLDKRQFSKAKEKLTEAYDESNHEEVYSELANCRDALDFATDGINLSKKGQFMEAKEKFQEAYSKCNFNNFCDAFANCRDTAETASEGLEHFIQGRYSESVAKFDEALSQSSEEKIKICLDNYKEVITIFISAQNLLNENRFNEAERHLWAALEKSESKKVNEIISNVLNTIVEKRTNTEKLYGSGKRLWNEAWEAENNLNADDAQNKFQDAKRKFEEAYNLINHSEYNRWITIVSLKIEGNESFNEGVQLQEQGNRLMKRKFYQEACKKYQEAKHHFQLGFSLTNDQRFNLCIEFIDDCVKEATVAAETQEIILLESNSTYNNSSIDEVQNEGIEEITGTLKDVRVVDRN